MNDFAYYALALVIGFAHAFEADHLAAVSNLVSTQKSLKSSAINGAFWGLGHTSTILLFSVLIIIMKFSIQENIFSRFEFLVGLMLIGLGIYRLYKLLRKIQHTTDNPHSHKLAYSVGLIHGLAGSGAIILVVLNEMKSVASSMLYLTLFGLGSMLGMLVAGAIMGNLVSLDFFKKYHINQYFSFASAIFCIVYGNYVVYENWGVL